MNNIRNRIEEQEKKILSRFASLSSQTRGRNKSESLDPIRTEYMRDRDRIIHSEAFRRLKHKTQVFLSPSHDLFRTRLTHTLEVSQISRTIAKALQLNEDLTEAISLGHDVGHTPFGHSGEDVIRELAIPNFKHSEQSVRVLDLLEKNGEGLNLTIEVLDGIPKHSKTGKSHILQLDEKSMPITMEAEIVRLSDTIAYMNHDIDDALKSGIFHENEIPEDIHVVLGKNRSERIHTMIVDLIEASEGKKHICMSERILEKTESLRNFLFANVYKHPQIMIEMDRAKNILAELFNFLKKNINIVYDQLSNAKYYADPDELRALVDFIALMTDNEVMKLYFKHFIPKSFLFANS